MTQNEILKELESLSIIVKISGGYFLTEKYKYKVISKEERKEEASKYNKVIDTSAKWSRNEYPDNIKFSSGKSLARAFMDICEVPAYSIGRRYRLRSITKDSIKVLTDIIDNPDINGDLLIKAVTHYYGSVESPKGFAKFILEDVLDIYEEFSEGESSIEAQKNNNETWG